MITEEMKKRLTNAGFTKNQAESKLTAAVVNFCMNEDEGRKALLEEAQRQVSEMRDTVNSLHGEYSHLKEKIDTVAGYLLDIAKAQEEHGVLTDEKAKNAVALYAAILSMNERAGARGTESVISAGYDLYAYLGGQARRDIHYDKLQDYDDLQRSKATRV